MSLSTENEGLSYSQGTTENALKVPFGCGMTYELPKVITAPCRGNNLNAQLHAGLIFVFLSLTRFE